MAAASLLAVSFAPPAAGAGVGPRMQGLRPGGAVLGVRIEDVGRQDVARLKLAEERGALVKSVEPDSAAQKAGLKDGDVILRYQGEAVQSAAQLARMVRETPPGRTVALEVSREGASRKLSATLEAGKGDRLDLGEIEIPPVPPIPPDAFRWYDHGKGRGLLFGEGWPGPRKLGIEFQDISGQLARYFHLSEDRGVLVESVEEGGPAAKAGVKAGDVILKLGGTAIRDGEDLRRELGRMEPGQEVALAVLRDGKPLDLKVKLGGEPHERKQGDET
jgi:serine protease Do